MSNKNNIAVVQRAYDCFKTGDIGGLLKTFAENITWTYPQVADVPYARSWENRAGVTEFFTTLTATTDCLQFEPRTFHSAGDQVIVQGTYEFRVKETGRSYLCEYVHFFTVNDGEITGFREYTDTAAVTAAFQKSMAA